VPTRKFGWHEESPRLERGRNMSGCLGASKAFRVIYYIDQAQSLCAYIGWLLQSIPTKSTDCAPSLSQFPPFHARVDNVPSLSIEGSTGQPAEKHRRLASSRV
jgi:hypothetical protein